MSSATRQPRQRLSRPEQNAQRSLELLDAAWAVFCEKGYEAVTIDDVAARAGYSRMPIYSLFGDKQTLFFELWRSKLGDLSKLFLSRMQPGTPLRRNLKLLAATIASGASVATQPNAGESLFFVVQTIALSRPEIEDRLQQLARQTVTDFADMIRHSTLARGEKLRNTPEAIAAHLIAQINGMSTVRFQTGRDYGVERDMEPIFLAIALSSGA